MISIFLAQNPSKKLLIYDTTFQSHGQQKNPTPLIFSETLSLYGGFSPLAARADALLGKIVIHVNFLIELRNSQG